ncbi:MAG: hypothetical protein FWE27_02805 [Defluviitaleaceae bacterium]|nr:hypothetical protein [Defluviitaleaceae bacterium]
MNKQTKKTAGMSMGIVIIFIMVMSVAVTALLVVSVNALRNANRLPQTDGEFFSAEAAMNRALPGIAESMITYIPIAPTTTAINQMVQEAETQIANANLIDSAFTSLDDTAQQNELLNFLRTNAVFQNRVKDAVSLYIQNALGGLPPAHDPVALLNGTVDPSTSSSIFWLIDGNDITSPQEGMAEPAFVNLPRDGGNVRIGWHDGGAFTDGISVSPPVVSGNTRTFNINIAPYITVNSYSGVVELTERILVPFSSFYISYEVNNGDPVVMASQNPDSFGCYGFCAANGITSGTQAHHFHPMHWANKDASAIANYLGVTHTGDNPNPQVTQILNATPGFSPRFSCGGINLVSPCNGDHRIKFDGSHPLPNVELTPMSPGSDALRARISTDSRANVTANGDVTTTGIATQTGEVNGNPATVTTVRLNHEHNCIGSITSVQETTCSNHGFLGVAVWNCPTPGCAGTISSVQPTTCSIHGLLGIAVWNCPNIFRIEGNRVVGLGSGQIRIGIAPNDMVLSVQNLRIINGNPILVGDFTGINVYVPNGTLSLGTSTEAFIVQNDPTGTPPIPATNIASSADTTVNVRDGFIAEYVSITSGLGAMTFASHGTGEVSMGAVFASQGHMTGTIRASSWINDQKPQFIGHQHLDLSLEIQDPISSGEMGALFHSTGGSHMVVHVDNGGHPFDGWFFSNTSAMGSSLNGHANLNVPPERPTMPIMPELNTFLNNLSGGPGGPVPGSLDSGGSPDITNAQLLP